MADSKKYDGSQWEHSLRKLTTATEIVESPLYADGTAITSYTIKGNTTQSGTPTPSNPVEVQGVGNKTANLFNINTSIIGKYIDANGVEQNSTSGQVCHSDYINVEPNEYYTMNFNKPLALNLIYAFSWWTDQKQFIYRDSQAIGGAAGNYTLTFQAPNNAKYLIINYSDFPDYDNEKIMVNTGSTPIPYEPYGYKIPISTTQGSAVNYLGSVQSTRQIRKLVLDGTETFYKDSGGESMYYIYINPVHAKKQQLYCTHLPSVADYPRNSIGMYAPIDVNSLIYLNVGIDIMNAQPSGNTVAGLKEYLAAQYANGTPVTLYYILATPTTGIVNEPLMKIGNYADSISNSAAIPTTDGANTITVDTTVQPSEFTATWTGWHDASVMEYGAAGANKFDYTTMASGITGYYLTSAGVETVGTAWAITDYIPCNGQSFTLGKIGGNAPSICLYDGNKTFIAGQAYNTGGAGYKRDITVTASQNAKYIRFSYFIDSPPDDLSTIMLNEGSTALPYEPYEYGWV